MFLLEGLWIVDGAALGITEEDSCGGGLYLDGGHNIRLIDCHFVGNLASNGGAVYCSGYPLFHTCTFESNVGCSGGGVMIPMGSPRFVNCNFHANRAMDGGAIYNL